jgi:hypothetical protein
MQTISRTLEKLETGPAGSFRNLTVFPLLQREGAEIDYLTLDEALAAGSAHITEVDEGGSVPELRLINEGDRPVLLLDGEELVGAKQNRVLNLTILAPPRSEIVIPVTCVEAGRWAYDTPDFMPAKHVMYHSGRASKLCQVSASMARGLGHRSDQSAIWRDIGRKLGDLEVESASSAMRDAYDRHDTSIEDYVRAIPHVDDQVGGVFAIDARVLGLELLDSAETMRRLLPKLVRSYALDAIASRGQVRQEPPVQSVRDLIEDVAAADTRSARALGLGEDVRLSGRKLAGGALIDRDRVVHLSAFRLDEGARSGEDDGGLPRLQPFSRRLRRYLRAS